MKTIETVFLFDVGYLNILHNTGFHIDQDYTKSTYNENLVINNLIKRML